MTLEAPDVTERAKRPDAPGHLADAATALAAITALVRQGGVQPWFPLAVPEWGTDQTLPIPPRKEKR